MAYQPINFANIAPIGLSGVRDLAQNLAQGYQAGRLPHELAQQEKAKDLANAMAEMRNQQEPARFQSEQNLRQARLNKLNRDLSNPFDGLNYSGLTGKMLQVELLAKRLGEDSPIVAKAREQLAIENESAQARAAYQNAMAGSVDKRYATQLGKSAQEQSEINQGFMPGTNRKEIIDLQRQKQLSNAYDLKRLKDTTDAATRQKNLYASNVEKTLQAINPDDLVQYAGIPGEVRRSMESGKAAFGKESESYDKYKAAITNLKLLQKQLRQFYGDSVQPVAVQKIDELTNPATWQTNPKLARQMYDSLMNTLGKEMQTYRDSLQSTAVYKGESGQNNADKGFTVLISPSGKKVRVPNSQVAAALASGGKRA